MVRVEAPARLHLGMLAMAGEGERLFGGLGVSVGRPAVVLEASPALLTTHPRAEIVSWDPDSPASVEAAAHGIDTLIYLVGVHYTRFELHPELMRKTLAGAINAGVRQILLIGTV